MAISIWGGEQQDGSSAVRALTESALLAAITVLLMFAGNFLPLAGMFLVLMWPVPVMLVILRHGIRYGLMTVAVTVVLGATFLGLLHAVFTGVTVVGFIGVIFGVGLRAGWDAPTLVGAASVVVAISFLMIIALSAPLLGVNIIETVRTSLQEGFEMAVDTYISHGLIDPEDAEQTEQQMQQAVELVDLLFPALFLMSAAVYALWTFLITRWFLPRLGYEVPVLPPFATWKAPVWLALVFLASFMLEMLWGQQAGPYWLDLARNVFFIVNMVYLVCGAALLYFFLQRYLRLRWVAAAACFFVAMQSFGALLLPLAAILDSGLDFRDRVGSQSA